MPSESRDPEFRGTEVFGRRRKPAEPELADAPHRPGTLLGILAIAAAVLTVVLVSFGISAAVTERFALATTLAYFSTGASIVAVVGGVGAMILDRGRGWGILAVLLGLAADPLILTRVLDWASGLG